MNTYSSGNPRVHISSDSASLIAAIEEYEAKITLFSNKDQLFLRGLIDDLHEELAIRKADDDYQESLDQQETQSEIRNSRMSRKG